MNTTKTVTASTPASTIVFIVFLVLKLTNNIDWSWWWVTSPLWLPAAAALAFVAIVGIIVAAVAGIGALFGRKSPR